MISFSLYGAFQRKEGEKGANKFYIYLLMELEWFGCLFIFVVVKEGNKEKYRQCCQLFS